MFPFFSVFSLIFQYLDLRGLQQQHKKKNNNNLINILFVNQRDVERGA